MFSPSFPVSVSRSLASSCWNLSPPFLATSSADSILLLILSVIFFHPRGYYRCEF
ncbi:MAG: hypothetical protein ABIC91_02295 [Nanoarchaeota archaeon]|nr:hypothetical protein [Nanoarchaeota archaeon]MBU1850746.1 hypothetical protein [Nanoarchaeota archaeon]